MLEEREDCLNKATRQEDTCTGHRQWHCLSLDRPISFNESYYIQTTIPSQIERRVK